MGNTPLTQRMQESADLALGTIPEGRKLAPLKVTKMSEVEARPVDWLWSGYLARGVFNLVDGEEGIGKTFLLLKIAASLAAEEKLPGDTRELPSAKTMLVSAEDSLPFVIKPRLDALKANSEQIVAIDERFTLNNEGFTRLGMAMELHRPDLLIFDPLFSYTGTINLNNDNEIRSITDRLNRLAETYECAIVGVRHIGKAKGHGDARNAGLNGVGWRAGARTAALVGKDPNTGEKAFVQTKNNIAPVLSQALGFLITEGGFQWTDKPSTLTAECMLAYRESTSTEEASLRAQAKEFLANFLADGPKASKAVHTAAAQAGISMRTLGRAKRDLHIQSEKDASFSGEWSWRLPDEEGGNKHANQEAQTESVGTLRPSPVNRDDKDAKHANQEGQTESVGTLRLSPVNTTSSINKSSEDGQPFLPGQLRGIFGRGRRRRNNTF